MTSPAMAKTIDALTAQAAKSVRGMIKARAGDYQREPRQLNAIAEDLGALPPPHLVTALGFVTRQQRRWVGFGGEVEEINLRGAALYARLARARAHAHKGRMKIFDRTERARLAAIDPVKASTEDQDVLDAMLEAQLSELGDGITRLKVSHGVLLAAVKQALARFAALRAEHKIDDEDCLDIITPLSAAIRKAERATRG